MTRNSAMADTGKGRGRGGLGNPDLATQKHPFMPEVNNIKITRKMYQFHFLILFSFHGHGFPAFLILNQSLFCSQPPDV